MSPCFDGRGLAGASSLAVLPDRPRHSASPARSRYSIAHTRRSSVPRPRRRPKPDRRRALELLASCRDGCTEAVPQARRQTRGAQRRHAVPCLPVARRELPDRMNVLADVAHVRRGRGAKIAELELPIGDPRRPTIGEGCFGGTWGTLKYRTDFSSGTCGRNA
jgi:hypothetical protein